ncbi:MAG: hypothetical protein CSA13_01295 [Clostridiales bacterium]|nr:MAG: hypothetical protein CSA13_01295 [Clostridiales bacterium]
MGKFTLNQTKTGFNFKLIAANGQEIGASQVYASLNSCKNGVLSVKKNAPLAASEDQTVEGFEKLKNPKFQIYTDKAGEFRFRLLAKNGKNILSSEGYKTKKSCLNGISSVAKNAPEAKVEKKF